MFSKINKQKESYLFSSINYEILSTIADFELCDRKDNFDDWFNYDYKINQEEEIFLKALIKKEEKYFKYYLEQQLKSRFIVPLLRQVDFYNDKFKDWYDYEISAIVNKHRLSGSPVLMIATGTIRPKKPYFFFQEFKKSKSESNPDFQVLTEMAVGIEKNKINLLRGAYNIGQFWNFLILEKVKDGKYNYYESESLDCLKINDLKQIFINLQAVKQKYCNS